MATTSEPAPRLLTAVSACGPCGPRLVPGSLHAAADQRYVVLAPLVMCTASMAPLAPGSSIACVAIKVPACPCCRGSGLVEEASMEKAGLRRGGGRGDVVEVVDEIEDPPPIYAVRLYVPGCDLCERLLVHPTSRHVESTAVSV